MTFSDLVPCAEIAEHSRAIPRNTRSSTSSSSKAMAQLYCPVTPSCYNGQMDIAEVTRALEHTADRLEKEARALRSIISYLRRAATLPV